MQIEQNESLMLGDTAVSDIFINEYLAEASGDNVKVYLYCLFLAKHNKDIGILDLAKKIGLELEVVRQAFNYWEEKGVFLRTEKGVIINDLKEKEINRLYSPKLVESVDELVENNNKNHRRSEAITAINNAFFQGVMSTSWYIDITEMFEKYQFEEEVMLALFKYCYDKHALHKNYLTTVAEDWFLNKVKNVHDLDSYYMKREKTNKIKKQIAKKMGIMRNLTEYEEAYIEKWTNEFGYDFAAIEVALKKTTAKTNPNFDYLNGIFRNWNEKGLKSKADIEEYLKQNKDKQKLIKDNTVQGAKPSSAYINPEQTEFNDLDRFYSNM